MKMYFIVKHLDNPTHTLIWEAKNQNDIDANLSLIDSDSNLKLIAMIRGDRLKVKTSYEEK